ncbi:ABC-F family ATP-binding cassette domain-containing protein [Ramlibacter sp. MMS24-I3-19]|uniref:ABC-F family ATP-binding cassette domain-containing protein n=1 Tax=Ramlibacter sp. MMS24-I3-19 TaxID=3416606 RepID=UPI003D080B1C
MIQLRNLTLRRSAKVLLDAVSVTINPGEKVALVGRNGAGKSSLFALFNGNLHEDAGEFSLPAQWRLSQVAQNMPETDESATAFVLGGDTRLMELRAELAQAEASDDGMRIAHAHSDLADAGEHDAVSRAQALILGLGFQVAELEQPVDSFSGGWRMRLQLARALMCPSDLLLLDEPTNHLDLDALVWLEAWLQRYAGTMIVISHDREFLDAVTNVTLHIENQKLTRYGANYSAFETMRALQLEQQQAQFARQQEKVAHLQKFIDRFKAKASKAKQAQSRVKALERMERIAPVLAEADFNFEFKEPANLPNPMLAISDAALGYGEKVILSGINRSVLAGQRIGILGANGQGKSTLVKTIAREIAPLAGTITEGKGLHIGYFAQQELDVLSPDSNPLEHMVRLARDVGPQGREQELRNFLGSFNFSGDMVGQAVGTMSGGEKARLVLAMIVWQRPNLLLLDEPTNHLDLATREALSVALNEFEGTVMLVSHDRALLRAVCDEFWLVGRGRIGPFDGDLDDYQRYLLDEAKRLREAARLEAAPAPTPAPVANPQEQRKRDAATRQQAAARAKPLKRELADIERRMTQLQAERQDLETQLASPLPPAQIADAGRKLKQAAQALEDAEERWLSLSGEIEALESDG